jgi:two-component sensor histidine kinase
MYLLHLTEEVETMMNSDKYAYVNIGGGVESIYIRIKKDTPMPEQDKAKLTAWADKNGFTVSAKKRILRAE